MDLCPPPKAPSPCRTYVFLSKQTLFAPLPTDQVEPHLSSKQILQFCSTFLKPRIKTTKMQVNFNNNSVLWWEFYFKHCWNPSFWSESTVGVSELTKHSFFILIRAGAENSVATVLASTHRGLSGDTLTFPTRFTLWVTTHGPQQWFQYDPHLVFS